MGLALGHRVFIPRQNRYFKFNGVSFQADGTTWFEFVCTNTPGSDPWTFSLEEVVALTR